MRPGPRNLITDVPGLLVGNATDHRLKSGVSVVLAERPVVAAVHVMGGAPGTRETDLLGPDRLVQAVDAVVLSGGSAFGLDAASGVADVLGRQGRGFAVGTARVPIVPGAILFDLLNGGRKDWLVNPYRRLGEEAMAAAAAEFALGSAGAGTGAMTADVKGGLGSASAVLESGFVLGALVAVNALGSVLADGGPQFLAAPFEFGDEFGGLGPGTFRRPGWEPDLPHAPEPGMATTIAVLATDARLSRAEATRLAVAAHDGMARAILPSHTPYDGDLVFVLATGERPLADPARDVLRLGHAAAACLARAIARGVHAAESAPDDPRPAWRQRFLEHS
ncbi:MAG: peptidase T4 [Alphaproteobacteria bacterium HGW-Alphaproteobacteria-2]|nr:MAG: peptidase T4 [Alphaproteobacteria bacterium HGW-Alphaproteobacteria-2]